MDSIDVKAFIEAMHDMGDDWEAEDVERVYGDKTLEEALADRRNDMASFANIIGTVLNLGN